jgi:hypothetical protein
MRTIRAWGGALALAAALAAPAANADSWALPTERTTASPGGGARVTVTPRTLQSQLAYFSDATENKDKPGQVVGGAEEATAHVEVKAADGTWRTLWRGPLRNDVAPVDVAVTDDGTRLVTLDNWHSMGHGDDVVVIHDERGQVVRRWSLEQLIGAAYVAQLPHSVSSIWWRGGEPAIVEGGKAVRIQVLAPGIDPGEDDESRSVPLLIDLADGTPRSTPEWTAALETLGGLETRRRADWAAYREARARPLSPPPANADGAAWRKYMVQVRERVHHAEGEVVYGVILADGSFRGCCTDPKRLPDTLEERADKKPWAVSRFLYAGPDGDALAAPLVAFLRQTAPGSLAGAKAWLSVDDAQLARVAAAAAASGLHVERVPVPMPGITLEAEPPEWFKDAGSADW